jgi:hypothetical protein
MFLIANISLKMNMTDKIKVLFLWDGVNLQMDYRIYSVMLKNLWKYKRLMNIKEIIVRDLFRIIKISLIYYQIGNL